VGVVLGVVGGSGGIGASTFAARLAAAAAPATLVDLDPVGGGLDTLLGIEQLPGARWSGLRLAGGYLDPALLAEGLPRWRSVAVLAADVPPTPAPAVQVVEVASLGGPVVVDLPRHPCPLRDEVLPGCALVVAVVAAGVRELAAARAVLQSLPGVAVDGVPVDGVPVDGVPVDGVPVGVVLRRGPVPVAEAVALLGAPLLGVLPASAPATGVPRAVGRVAAGLLDGLSDGLSDGPRDRLGERGRAA